jgi:hypothetical protein
MIFKTNPAYGARAYYYLHVSSYQKETLANKDVEQLKKKGYTAIARREKIPNKGYWYRVYVGPFSAHMEAYLKAKELKKKKIVDYAAIQKKSAPIGGDLAKATAVATTTSKASKTTSEAGHQSPLLQNLPKKQNLQRPIKSRPKRILDCLKKDPGEIWARESLLWVFDNLTKK